MARQFLIGLRSLQSTDRGGRNLNLPAKIIWNGNRGLKWDQVEPTIENMVKTLSPPDVLLFHVGSNDLTSDTSAISFANTIQCTLYRYNALWPKTTLVWSSVLARRYWHHVALQDGPKIKKKAPKAQQSHETVYVWFPHVY